MNKKEETFKRLIKNSVLQIMKEWSFYRTPFFEGVRHPQNLNPSFSIFFILVIDVILMGFGYGLNKFYI